MVDVSHGNSGKRHERQIEVASGLAERIAAGERRIFGLMIESHLEAGRQDLVPGVPLEARRLDHRRLHRLRPDGAGAALARVGRRGAAAPALTLPPGRAAGRGLESAGSLYSSSMSRLFASFFLIALLSACASSTARTEECTLQWPPGPCVDAPRK